MTIPVGAGQGVRWSDGSEWCGVCVCVGGGGSQLPKHLPKQFYGSHIIFDISPKFCAQGHLFCSPGILKDWACSRDAKGAIVDKSPPRGSLRTNTRLAPILWGIPGVGGISGLPDFPTVSLRLDAIITFQFRRVISYVSGNCAVGMHCGFSELSFLCVKS